MPAVPILIVDFVRQPPANSRIPPGLASATPTPVRLALWKSSDKARQPVSVQELNRTGRGSAQIAAAFERSESACDGLGRGSQIVGDIEAAHGQNQPTSL